MLEVTAINIALRGIGGTIESVSGGASGDNGILETMVRLSGGTTLSLAFWRLLDGNGPIVTSLEHGHARGAPAIDAVSELRNAIAGRTFDGLLVDAATGDLLLDCGGGLNLCAFRFRSLYEDWEVRTADGQYFWSNMIDFAPRRG